MLNKKKYLQIYLLLNVLSILLLTLSSTSLPRHTAELLSTGNHRSFLPEQLPSLVSLLWICLCQVLNLQLSFWIFTMFLTSQSSTCVGPSKRTGNPLITQRVSEVQFQLHTRWGCILFPLINIQSTYFSQINIIYFSCHCYKIKILMTSWIILLTSKLAEFKMQQDGSVLAITLTQ